MRLIMLTALTMLAFAANSLLNRLAVDSGAASPGAFALVRVCAGAAVLCLLVLPTRGMPPLLDRKRLTGALSLTLYMVGFSTAYLTLDAGLGALVLFGVVQITMFTLAALRETPPLPMQLLGAAVAFAGLSWVLWPSGQVQVPLAGAAFMIAAGLGWALYTMSGRGAADALAVTAANFLLALPLTALATLIGGGALHITGAGLALALVSGAITSGLGYALWYRVLPDLPAAVAATVQLSVPVIAIAAGALMLGEATGPRLLVGTVLVLGGITLVVISGRRA